MGCSRVLGDNAATALLKKKKKSCTGENNPKKGAGNVIGLLLLNSFISYFILNHIL